MGISSQRLIGCSSNGLDGIDDLDGVAVRATLLALLQAAIHERFTVAPGGPAGLGTGGARQALCDEVAGVPAVRSSLPRGTLAVSKLIPKLRKLDSTF